MSSDARNYFASVLSRLSILENSDGINAKLSDSQSRRRVKSFSLQYLLKEISSNPVSLDVEVLKYSLLIAYEESVEEAFSFIDDVTENIGREESVLSKEDYKKILSLKTFKYNSIANNLPLADKYLFSSEDKYSDHAAIRLFYEEAMSSYGISLPFNKNSMLQLSSRLDVEVAASNFSKLEELREFVWNFVWLTWPIFDVTALLIPFKYFDTKSALNAEDIGKHFESLQRFGLERILSRLVALRAVMGNPEAIKAFEQKDIKAGGQFSIDRLNEINSFLDGDRKIETKIENSVYLNNNPIERAIHLIIYLNNKTDTANFLERLTEVYCIDNSVLSLIDWENFSNEIDDAAFYTNQYLVFMAAAFCDGETLINSANIQKQYVPTGASTDLEAYARWCRNERKMSPYQFFTSFNVLPVVARKQVFRYLLSPGVLDTIAYVFETTPLPLIGEQNEAINVLSFKLDCVNYLKRRRFLFDQSELRAIEYDARRQLRQLRYEMDTSEGRIRINNLHLTTEVKIFLEELAGHHFVQINEFRIANETLRHEVVSRRLIFISESISDHICFHSRFAFDYLLSNLRHNFLRYKIESAIDDAFDEATETDTSVCKTMLESFVNDFNTKWLTLSPSRSFFAELKRGVLEILRSHRVITESNIEKIAEELTEYSINHCSALLESCRDQWRNNYCTNYLDILFQYLDHNGFKDQTDFKDKVRSTIRKAFDDSGNWIAINSKPVAKSFGVRDLFAFEATNFSSAKTRRKPLKIECYNNSVKLKNYLVDDVYVLGEYFSLFVQLIQNLLENSFDNSGLPKRETEIKIFIIKKNDGNLEIQFRNKFKPSLRSEMSVKVDNFQNHMNRAFSEVQEAPRQVGGSGLRRVVFEAFPRLQSSFVITADKSELKNDTFLVRCILSLKKF